ncbi:hypothetical protein HHI36_001542 [Cryptolaemus montrouzieri]|uniref:Uncharacterized protein n=1 Tax=Cryptolaemus montrouzieri TaxID=559131 RepID=A0ABD2P7Y6_9CUCU
MRCRRAPRFRRISREFPKNHAFTATQKWRIDFVECFKCSENFQPSCIIQAASKKSSVCHHEVSRTLSNSSVGKPTELSVDYENEYRVLRIQVNLSQSLLNEMKNKNDILIENDRLLLDNNQLIQQNIKNGNYTKFDKNQDNVAQKEQKIKIAGDETTGTGTTDFQGTGNHSRNSNNQLVVLLMSHKLITT